MKKTSTKTNDQNDQGALAFKIKCTPSCDYKITFDLKEIREI